MNFNTNRKYILEQIGHHMSVVPDNRYNEYFKYKVNCYSNNRDPAHRYTPKEQWDYLMKYLARYIDIIGSENDNASVIAICDFISDAAKDPNVLNYNGNPTAINNGAAGFNLSKVMSKIWHFENKCNISDHERLSARTYYSCVIEPANKANSEKKNRPLTRVSVRDLNRPSHPTHIPTTLRQPIKSKWTDRKSSTLRIPLGIPDKFDGSAANAPPPTPNNTAGSLRLGELKTLKEENKKLSAEILKLKTLKEENKKLSAEILEFKDENKKLSAEVLEFKDENKKLSAEVLEFKDENKKLNAEVLELDNLLDDYRLRNAESSNILYSDDLADAKHTINGLHCVIDGLEQSIKTLTNNNEDLTASNQKLLNTMEMQTKLTHNITTVMSQMTINGGNKKITNNN
jgi:hypothetical protein